MNVEDRELARPGNVSSGDRPTTDEHGTGLFGERTLEAYAEGMGAAVELIRRRIGRVDRPFSGALPEELAARFRDVDLDRACGSLEAALAEVETLYLDDAVYFHHPHYVAHLNCPVAVSALVGELIASTVNTAVETWDQSAGATFIEQKLVDWTAGRIGFDRRADGVFTSGGTQSNLVALMLSRDAFCRRQLGIESVQQSGLPPQATTLRILASEVSHFSVQKAAGILGLGHDSVVSVACDDRFRMDPWVLERAIEACLAEGNAPIAVVATAGTTDFGSIDPLDPVATLCRRYGLWMHVDAAYGCGLLASVENAQLVAGIERADSVTVDYHKSFFQPVSCSALILRDGRHLSSLTWHADYLNPLSDDLSGTPNLVNKSIQTTRRFDALKLWLTLRTVGADAVGSAFDRILELARNVYWRLLSDPDFEVIHQPVLSTLVFRYRAGGRVHTTSALDLVNERIRAAVSRSGRAVIAATTVRGERYLKFTLLDPDTTIDDLEPVIQAIRECGEVAHEQLRRDHAGAQAASATSAERCR